MADEYLQSLLRDRSWQHLPTLQETEQGDRATATPPWATTMLARLEEVIRRLPQIDSKLDGILGNLARLEESVNSWSAVGP